MNKRFNGLLGTFLGMLSIIAIPAMATTPLILSSQATQDQIVKTLPDQNTLTIRAKQWGLSTKAFKRYVWLMQNTPSGHWYKHLDPAEVLALNAGNRDEMMKYAKIQARMMHMRVTRELAFDQIYSEAYKALYPREKPVMSPDHHTLSQQTLQRGDRIWLFVGVNTPLGRFVYQHIMKVVQATPGVVLDIYFVGQTLSPARIQQWAIAAGISRDAVNTQVTLNIGNARFKAVTHGKHVHLPFVGVVHGNHFQPITLSSVL